MDMKSYRKPYEWNIIETATVTQQMGNETW